MSVPTATAGEPGPTGAAQPFAAGMVTGGGIGGGAATGGAAPGGAVAGGAVAGGGAPGAPARRPGVPVRRRALFWYGGAAGAIVAVGVVVLLVLVLTGQLGSGRGPFAGHAQAPSDVAPPLAKLCPAPSEPVPLSGDPVAVPPGPRTVDDVAGISYRAYGTPWRPWASYWFAGTLAVPYGQGQYFVTETYDEGRYLASILSGAVPATVNDSTAIDIECTGRQVAADVRVSYYPQPTTMDVLRAGRTTLGGRPAWETVFRLHFHRAGLAATDELVGVALIDVGRPTAAVLYVSIPGTHHQWDHAVDEVLQSVRPL